LNERVLDDEAQRFLSALVREHAPGLEALLAARRSRQQLLDTGVRLDFLDETRAVRESAWHVAPIPKGLERRVVELTGPAERRKLIHALNSGADVFMADFEDATAPTWSNLIEGQWNVYEAVRGTLASRNPDGSTLKVGSSPATLMFRPRGLHLVEAHVRNGEGPIPAALFDFGLMAFHNAREQLSRHAHPCFYLPKLESHLEARFWRNVFRWSEDALNLTRGSLKATVLIETLPAAFEMDEVLFELRDHALGLNCGRWDYIFSAIKTLRADPSRVLPDRDALGMSQPFLRAYSERLIQTCHRRGALALGGMAAQIPVKGDPVANETALAAVRADKQREARAGHDGTWVAHPGLVAVAREAFDAVLQGAPNQLSVTRDDVRVGKAELLALPSGQRTEAGFRNDVRVGVEYLANWLRGSGCVPIDHRMEDAATFEICRALTWQSLRHGAVLDHGGKVELAFAKRVLSEELRALDVSALNRADSNCLHEAGALFAELALDATRFEEFSTIPAYARLVAKDGSQPFVRAAGEEDTE